MLIVKAKIILVLLAVGKNMGTVICHGILFIVSFPAYRMVTIPSKKQNGEESPEKSFLTVCESTQKRTARNEDIEKDHKHAIKKARLDDDNGSKRSNKKISKVPGSIDFSNVDESRTFFVEVSMDSFKIQWLDLGANKNKSVRTNKDQEFFSQSPRYGWYPPLGYHYTQFPNYPPYQPAQHYFGFHVPQHVPPMVIEDQTPQNLSPHSVTALPDYGPTWNWAQTSRDTDWFSQSHLHSNHSTGFSNPPANASPP